MADPQHSSAGDCTRVVPFCEVCPPLWKWPDRNLILGTCPRCMKTNDNGWREMVARRIIEVLHCRETIGDER